MSLLTLGFNEVEEES